MSLPRALLVLCCTVTLLACGTPPSPPGPQDAGNGGGGGAGSGSADAGAGGGSGGGGSTGGGAGGGTAEDAGPPIDAPVDQWAFIPVEGSACGSGATAGIGLNLAASREELFIYLQGGGACWNQGTCVPSLLQFGPLCDYGTFCLINNPGGTQPTATFVTHPNPFPADGGGAFPSEVSALQRSLATDRARADNPFRNASYVFVPYCTGDLHAGASERTYQYKYQLLDQPQPYTVHHSGAANMDAYLARLRATFPEVKRVWLTGSSAGGYGATLNFERVRRAFPRAEVHLLADSSPFIPTPRWTQWRDTWNLGLPQGCADCDAGFPEVSAHLARTYPDSRQGLLSYEQDKVIAWFFFAPPGAGNFLNPPVGAFTAALSAQAQRYDAQGQTQYFIVPGDQHVLWGDYGTRRADGGYTAARPSADGGTDIKAFIDAWATQDAGWRSAR